MKDIVELMKDIIKYPDARICKHYIACLLLEILEKNGLEISNNLAEALVQCNDELALIELEKM